MQVSVFAWLYEPTVPRDHFLPKVQALVDLSFINKLVADTYFALALPITTGPGAASKLR